MNDTRGTCTCSRNRTRRRNGTEMWNLLDGCGMEVMMMMMMQDVHF